MGRRIYQYKTREWLLENFARYDSVRDKFRIDAPVPVDDAARVGFWDEYGNITREMFLRGLLPKQDRDN